MSCSCTTVTPVSPTGECLPSIADDCALAKPAGLCRTCPEDPNCLTADRSDGTTLESKWLDAVCENEGVTLLARLRNKLTRFSGNGFLQLVNGQASLVPAIPIKLVHLWHRWWKPTPASTPILGEPLDFTYQGVGDAEGNFYAIKGAPLEDSLTVWNATDKVFRQTPLSEVKNPVKGLLPTAAAIELVGYVPIPEDGEPCAVRQLSRLAGAGILVVAPAVTVACEDNPCDSSTASVTQFLALPVPIADETYTLKFSTVLGLHWDED